MRGKVVYLMSGVAHVPYLLVSLHSLRKHHPDAAVSVFAWSESYDLIKSIQERAPELDFNVVRRDPAYRGKNDQFIDKINLMRSLVASSSVPVVYLDADTMVTGSLDRLFADAIAHEFAATQFCDWKIQGLVRGRIAALLDTPMKREAATLLSSVSMERLPSVNGGVFAAFGGAVDFLSWWYKSTVSAKDVFIADEAVLHLIHVTGFAHTIIEGGSYNCSPKFQPHRYGVDVHIWHFHGDSNVRPEKAPRGFAIWWEAFRKLTSENVGGSAEWSSKCGNKWIDALIAKGL